MVFLLHRKPILFNVLVSLDMEIISEFNINLMVALSNASSFISIGFTNAPEPGKGDNFIGFLVEKPIYIKGWKMKRCVASCAITGV